MVGPSISFPFPENFIDDELIFRLSLLLLFSSRSRVKFAKLEFPRDVQQTYGLFGRLSRIRRNITMRSLKGRTAGSPCFTKRVIEHGISHQSFIIGDLRDFVCFDATPERGRR